MRTRDNPSPTLFIVVEGIDGTGKSIQAKKLVRYLQAKLGVSVYLTKEPTLDGPAGVAIRSTLIGGESRKPLALQKLFIEDRDWHLHYEIIPQLAQGNIVVSDRYFFSTVAYGSLDIDFKKLLDLHKGVEDFWLPDLTILIDLDPEVALARGSNNSERDIFEEKDKLTKVRATYIKLSRMFETVSVINGDQDEDAIFHEMIPYVHEALARKQGESVLRVREQKEEYAAKLKL